MFTFPEDWILDDLTEMSKEGEARIANDRRLQRAGHGANIFNRENVGE